MLRQIFLACLLVAIPHVAGAQGCDAAPIRPFAIHVPDAVLVDLKARLTHARIPEALQRDGWTYGTDGRYLEDLVAYWREQFDWREQERRLNRLEQFTTTIDGLTIHFIHRRSKQPNALPLLITHGWPGSFVEFTKVVGPLTDPVAHGGRPDDGFHVVIPSIPGFAFSDKPREAGYDPARIAAIEAKLMARLGYQQIQGTKPQTIGVALNDSPVGLAAWIVEKFHTWCDCDGNPENVFTKDELLTNIMLYWVTQTAASSARIYYETRHAAPAPNARRVEVPTACADFPKEIIWSPRRWLEPRFNITRWTSMPRGSHFAAFEQPALLVDDVRAFFRDLRF